MKSILARLRREPALVGGVLVSAGQVLVDNPSWESALPVLASLVVRQLVTPVTGQSWTWGEK